MIPRISGKAWCVKDFRNSKIALQSCQPTGIRPTPFCSWRYVAAGGFTGVSWDKKAQKYTVRVWFEKKTHCVGFFEDATEAARAYDARLRALCHDGVRLKKSLNFPSQSELCFVETPADARARALATHADKAAKEEMSRQRLLDRFAWSPAASTYEIVWVPGFARVDALFQPKGCMDGGLCLQLKSASPLRNSRSTWYSFNQASGYKGMLMLLIALDQDLIWAASGKAVDQRTFRIRLGSSRDESLRATDVGTILKCAYRSKLHFPRMRLQEARRPSSPSHKVEHTAHTQMTHLLSSAGVQLDHALSAAATVDSLLTSNDCIWRVQEKSTNLRSLTDRSGRYQIGLWKHGGALRELAYEANDFDILLAAVLDQGQLCGLYVFPMAALVARGLVGVKPTWLRLYPPWAPSKQEPTRLKHAWQLDHFVDLREWGGHPNLPAQARIRLAELLGKLELELLAGGSTFAVTP